MVLHQNKWDRKATKAHVRKLQGNGKATPEKTKVDYKQNKTRSSQHTAHHSGESTEDESRPEPEEVDVLAPGNSVEAAAQIPDTRDEDQTRNFTKRKVGSNAWRYESEEPGFPLAQSAEEEEELELEPEPDYVSLTLQRESQIKDLDRASVEVGLIDEEFLRDRMCLQRGAGGDFVSKGRVVKGDKQEFQDIANKISKQANVDTFKARFGPRRAKGVTRRGLDLETDEGDNQDAPDLEAFLQDLDFRSRGKEKSLPVIPVTIGEKSEVTPQENNEYSIMHKDKVVKDENDDWLDSMLERPRRR